MGDPCRQEGTIGELQATLDAVSSTLDEIKKGQAQFITLLQEIARQSEQIKSMVQRTDKTEKDVQCLFKRMRDVELAPGKQASSTHMAVIAAVIAAVVAYISKKIGA